MLAMVRHTCETRGLQENSRLAGIPEAVTGTDTIPVFNDQIPDNCTSVALSLPHCVLTYFFICVLSF